MLTTIFDAAVSKQPSLKTEHLGLLVCKKLTSMNLSNLEESEDTDCVIKLLLLAAQRQLVGH